MENRNQHINEEVLQNVLQGSASAAQEKVLNEWLQASDANKALFEKMKQIWSASKQLNVFSEIDEKADWKKIQAKRRSKKNRLGSWLKYAAAVVISLGVSLVYLHENTAGFGKIAQTKTEQDQSELVLADGTKVYLNKNSKLVYPKKFDGDKRLVKLQGEAFFDVKPNAEKPFIIESGEAIIEVLGTSFNVYNKADNWIELSVRTGKVSLKSKKDKIQELVLVKGDVALLRNHKVIKLRAKFENQDSWRTRALKFHQAPLKQVLKDLEKHYDVKFENRNQKIKDLKITIAFDNKKIEKVIRQLELLLQVRIIKHKNIYIIK
jgi:ferric-dicitrate binding protein FerR (iron transport regulator)